MGEQSRKSGPHIGNATRHDESLKEAAAVLEIDCERLRRDAEEHARVLDVIAECGLDMHGDRYAVFNIVKRSTFRIDTSCLEWGGAISPNGYGRIKVGGKLRLPHRVMAVAAGIIRDLDDKKLVLHRCDNPKCCNPKHLFSGTASDNMRDCAAKGRLNTQQSKRPTD